MRFWKVSISSHMNCSDGSVFPVVLFLFDHCIDFKTFLAQPSVNILNYLQKISIFRGILPLWHLSQLKLPFPLKLYLQQAKLQVELYIADNFMQQATQLIYTKACNGSSLNFIFNIKWTEANWLTSVPLEIIRKP